MNFSKIRLICEQKNIQFRTLIEKIGISEAGFYQILRTESIKVDVLEKIAAALQVPIWVFFDLDPEAPLKSEIDKMSKELQYERNNNSILTNEMIHFRTEIDHHIKFISSLLSNIDNQKTIIEAQKDAIALLRSVAYPNENNKTASKG